MLPSAELLLRSLSPWRAAPRWWLGLSGGLDSCVLLRLLVEAREQAPLPPVTAVHVDHQLSPNADAWSRHCDTLCRAAGLALVTRRVNVEQAAPGGREAAARNARYEVFEELVAPGEVLLLAHHLDDQVETFFLRLMRGAGPRGLAGMPKRRRLGQGELCRPLLDCTREELEQFATARGLHWTDDESNLDLSLDRNYLRHRVLPALGARWPAYRASIAASIVAVADAQAALSASDRSTVEAALSRRFGEAVLDIGALGAPGAVELARVLRGWLEAEGYSPPGREQLVEFSRQLFAAKRDARPSLAGADYCLRRYRDAVHLCPARLYATAPTPCVLAPGEVRSVPGVGRLEMRRVDRGGLRVPAAGHWVIRYRAGGERCRPLGRARSQSLKKLLQNSDVPPWVRQRLPLLYAGDELAAVADLWVCSGQEAGDAAGYELVWRLAEAVVHD